MKESVAIIGTGLIGASVGMSALRSNAATTVVGYDFEPERMKEGLRMGALTGVANSPSRAVEGASLVVIAVPVLSIPESFSAIAGSLEPGTLVTDVGSAKSLVVETIGPMVPDQSVFIGGHPLAGSEQEGTKWASAEMFRGATWILTPTPEVDAAAYGRLVRFVGALGAKALSLDPASHDALVALTSHVPQVIASALMEHAARTAAEDLRLPLLGAGGFGDMTRIAASDTAMWMDILASNHKAVIETLQGVISSLDQVLRDLKERDWDRLSGRFERARRARMDLPMKAGVTHRTADVLVRVDDSPGELAGLTTALGEAGVNIEDLRIVHSPEGGRGGVHVSVAIESVGRAIEALTERGFASAASSDDDK